MLEQISYGVPTVTEHRLFDVILSYQTQHEVTIQIQALDVHEAERKALSTPGLKLLPWTLKQPPKLSAFAYIPTIRLIL
jgi:hypothetical protein